MVSIFGASSRGLALLLASPLVVVGLYFASKRTTALESQNAINSERLLTETFAKSIELLGSEQVAVRQGAIYALGKIAGEKPTELTVIVNTLCAYIRHNQSREEDREGKLVRGKFKKLPIDIEAAVKTIVMLSEKFELNVESHIATYDLSNIYLPYADFSRAKLSNFNISDAYFYECIFEKVDFDNSNLVGSTFEKSIFKGVKFNKHTEIMKTDFSTTEQLEQNTVNKAHGNSETELPPGINKPSRW